MRSKIDWCTHGWNVISGCTKISEGCKNCYASDLHNRFNRAFGDFNNVRFNAEKLSEPKHIRKPANIFVNALSDTFHESVHEQEIDFIMRKIEICNRHNYLMLTKREDRLQSYMNSYEFYQNKTLPDNLWLGVTVENQRQVHKRIEKLIKILSANKFLSLEPLLEAVDIEYYLMQNSIHWIIVGCESGLHKRECKLGWIESIIKQCSKYDVPVFVKQIKINGNVIKDFNEFPDNLKVRQVPYKLYDNFKYWKPELKIQKHYKKN